MVPRVAGRPVPTAPITPVHRSKEPVGGGTGCPLEDPRPPLGRFDDPPEGTLALAVRVV